MHTTVFTLKDGCEQFRKGLFRELEAKSKQAMRSNEQTMSQYDQPRPDRNHSNDKTVTTDSTITFCSDKKFFIRNSDAVKHKSTVMGNRNYLVLKAHGKDSYSQSNQNTCKKTMSIYNLFDIYDDSVDFFY